MKTPCCPRCRHPGFWRFEALDGRPAFWCDKCRNEWTCGHGGGEYVGHEIGLKEKP